MTRLRRYHLYLVILSSGAAVMAVEILGTRMLAPHFGLDLYVWAALISVTLALIFLGERLEINQRFGIVAVSIGIALVLT